MKRLGFLGTTRKRQAAGAVFASLAIAAFFAVPSPASAAPDKEIVTSDDPSAGSNVDAERMRAQEPLVNAAAAITALDPNREGLGGIRLQVDKGAVEVYWKGDVPGSVKEEIEAQEKAGISIVLGSADFSGSELTAAENQIVEARDRYPGLAVIAPQPDGSGLQGYFSDPKAAQSYEFPVPVALGVAPKGTVLTSRSNDSVPWWAGAVTRVNGGTCTTGFAVAKRFLGVELSRGVLSAGHCDPSGGHVFTNGTGVPIGTAGAPVSISDSIYIPSKSAGRTYDGGVGVGEFSKAVIAPTPNFPGQFVCTSGAATGAHCAIMNYFVGGISVIGGRVTFGITLAVQIFGQIASGQGDSGGPVIASSNPFTALAAGLMSFIIGGTRCPSGSGLCSSFIGYVDINWVLLTNFPMTLA